MRQVVLLYDVPSENKLDVGKDLYDGRLVAIDDIPTTNVEAGDDPPVGTKSSWL